MGKLKSQKILFSLLLVGIAQTALPNTTRIVSHLKATPLGNSIESQVVDQPIFTILDSNGKAIDVKKGTSGGLLRGMKVVAGDGFRVTNMEVTIARGTARVATIVVTGERPDMRAWALAPGDRLSITIKKVIRTADKSEVAFENGMIVIPII